MARSPARGRTRDGGERGRAAEDDRRRVNETRQRTDATSIEWDEFDGFKCTKHWNKTRFRHKLTACGWHMSQDPEPMSVPAACGICYTAYATEQSCYQHVSRHEELRPLKRKLNLNEDSYVSSIYLKRLRYMHAPLLRDGRLFTELEDGRRATPTVEVPTIVATILQMVGNLSEKHRAAVAVGMLDELIDGIPSETLGQVAANPAFSQNAQFLAFFVDLYAEFLKAPNDQQGLLFQSINPIWDAFLQTQSVRDGRVSDSNQASVAGSPAPLALAAPPVQPFASAETPSSAPSALAAPPVLPSRQERTADSGRAAPDTPTNVNASEADDLQSSEPVATQTAEDGVHESDRHENQDSVQSRNTVGDTEAENETQSVSARRTNDNERQQKAGQIPVTPTLTSWKIANFNKPQLRDLLDCHRASWEEEETNSQLRAKLTAIMIACFLANFGQRYQAFCKNTET